NHETVSIKVNVFLCKCFYNSQRVFQFVTTNLKDNYTKIISKKRLDKKNLAINDDAVTIDKFKERLMSKIRLKLILQYTNESIHFVDNRKALCEYVEMPILKSKGERISILEYIIPRFENKII